MNVEDYDDRTIVQRVIAGESELFGQLVRRHQRAVYGLGLSFFRNGEDADDFVQDVFLKAFRSLSSFQGRSRFSTWLYRIAYNTAINGVKRRKEYRSLAEDEEIPDFDSPERRVLRLYAQEAVTEAIKELPERYRICIDLYFFYDRSYPEIEAVTGFPVNTIKSHVFRAKQLLRKRLSNEAEGGF
ncbi:sigma-70 family RNA polymerase sigma factor [Treponema sp.]